MVYTKRRMSQSAMWEGGMIRDPYIPFLLPKSWVNWRVHV